MNTTASRKRQLRSSRLALRTRPLASRKRSSSSSWGNIEDRDEIEDSESGNTDIYMDEQPQSHTPKRMKSRSGLESRESIDRPHDDTPEEVEYLSPFYDDSKMLRSTAIRKTATSKNFFASRTPREVIPNSDESTAVDFSDFDSEYNSPSDISEENIETSGDHVSEPDENEATRMPANRRGGRHGNRRNKVPRVRFFFFYQITRLTVTQAVRERRKLERWHPYLTTLWEDLAKIPTINPVAAPQPAGISRKLKPFQLEGLDWMVKQEASQWKGGLLGDEMGMGKTIQAVSLLMSDYPAGFPSLVVVPPVALMQWQSEVQVSFTSPMWQSLLTNLIL